MQTLRRNWYSIGAVVAVGALIYLIFAWSSLSVLQRLLLLNFVAMLLHQFEEYRWPGGFPAVWNLGIQESATPDRYPANANSVMIVNLFFPYAFCLIPVFFPQLIWLGLAPMLMGFGQFAVHAIMINRKLRTWYNPGLATVLLLFIPLDIAYIIHIQSNGLASGWDWLIGVLYMTLFTYLTLMWGLNKLADKNSPYPFDAAQMRRFNVPEKVARAKALAAH